MNDIEDEEIVKNIIECEDCKRMLMIGWIPCAGVGTVSKCPICGKEIRCERGIIVAIEWDRTENE